MNYLKVDKTARIETFGNPNAKKVWVALHGYGQLVPYFIRPFHVLDPKTNFVIAPEGLHRFYLNGTSGRVGASWMTKEERLQDIEDYLQYLDDVYKKMVPEDAYKVLLGFSQGVATASRWLNLTQNKFDTFIQWAGVFPPDLKSEELKHMHEVQHYYVYGNNDPYFSEEKMKEIKKKFHEWQLSLELLTFEGNHQLDANVLTEIESKIVQ